MKVVLDTNIILASFSRKSPYSLVMDKRHTKGAELCQRLFVFLEKFKIMQNTLSTPFSNAQLELLKLFSSDLSPVDLEELKRILLAFKFKRVTQLADKIWEEKEWTEEDMKEMLHTHMRTPYESQNKALKNKPEKP